MTNQHTDLSRPGDLLLYDGDCPFCSNYIELLAVRQVSPDFQVVNARREPELWNAMLRQGHDIDRDMMLRWKGHWYYGGDAIHVLSLIAGSGSAFGRVNRWIFRSPFRSRVFYPFMRWGRNTTLRFLGVPGYAHRRPVDRTRPMRRAFR